MPTLDTTIGGTNTNSFISESYFDTYWDEKLHVDPAISGAVIDEKRRACITVSRILSDDVDWDGYRASSTQALSHPRGGLYDQDGFEFASNAIAPWLEKATAEFAGAMLVKDRTADVSWRGLRSLQSGPTALVFDGLQRPPVIPELVQAMIAPYGKIRGRGFQSRVVKT